MINLCTDPTCDETAALSIQRQGDVAPVVYCLPHGYQRENELKQKLENFRTVVLERPPTELEQALARVQELEEELTEPGGSVVDGEPGAGDTSTAEQLATTLHTLETQARTLASVRSELADKDQALQSLRKELDRTRGDLERTRSQLAAALEAAKTAPAPAEPRDTPPPPTRPDAAKP